MAKASQVAAPLPESTDHDYGLFNRATLTVDHETNTGCATVPLKNGLFVDVRGPIPALCEYIMDNPAGELLSGFAKRRKKAE